MTHSTPMCVLLFPVLLNPQSKPFFVISVIKYSAAFWGSTFGMLKIILNTFVVARPLAYLQLTS